MARRFALVGMIVAIVGGLVWWLAGSAVEPVPSPTVPAPEAATELGSVDPVDAPSERPVDPARRNPREADQSPSDAVRSIAGTVYDIVGRPVVGAMIHARYHAGLMRVVELGTTASDADGGFAFTHVPPDVTRALVDVTAKGHAPADAWVRVDEPHRFVLGGPGALEGRVVDSRGAPIAGCVVSVLAGHSSKHTKSDADGRFTLRHLSPGGHTVQVRSPVGTWGVSRSTVIRQGATTRVEIAMPAGVCVVGVITDAETTRPIVDAVVETNRGMPRASARSDSSGRYELRGHSSGSEVRVRAPGYARVERVIRAATGDDGADVPVEASFALVRGANVSGIVTCAGQPIDGVRVRFGPQSGRTSSDGRFAFTDVPPDEPIELRIDDPRFVPHRQTVDVPGPRAAAANVHVRLDRGTIVHGSATDAMGMALADGVVRVESVERTHVQRSARVRDGEWEIRGVAAGRYRVILTPLDGDARRTWLDVVVPAVDRHRLDLRAEPGLSITGIVVDAAGAPVSGARLRVHRNHRAGDGSRRFAPRGAESDRDGCFRIGNLVPGPYALYVDGRIAGSSAPIEAGATGVRIVVEPLRTVRGFVRDARTHAPVTRFWVTAARVDEGGVERSTFRSHVVDSEGRFQRVMTRGRHLLRVGADDGRVSDPRVIEIGPSGSPPPFDVFVAQAETMDGRCVDRTGTPVANARVEVFGEHDGGWLALAVAWTDAAGLFRVAGLRPGMVRVVAVDRTAGHATRSVTIPMAGTAPNLVLAPAYGTVRLEVRRDGKPLADAPVRPVARDGCRIGVDHALLARQFRMLRATRPTRPFRTDARGELTLTEMPPGEWTFAARDGGQSVRARAWVSEGVPTRVVIALPAR